MADAALTALLIKAQSALAGKPPWGKSLCVNFGLDGVIFVYPNNVVAEIVSANVQADCHISLSINALNKLIDGEESALAEWWSGELKVDNRGVAEEFASILTGKPKT